MALSSSITIGSLTLRVRLPESTREVLEYRSFIAPRLEAAWRSEEGEGLLQAVEWALAWLSRHCEESAEWLDEHLADWQIHLACLHIIGAATVGKDVAEEVEQWATMLGEGGCQCKICEDPDKAEGWDEKTRALQEKRCKWVSVSPSAQNLIGCVHSLQGADMLQAPWYLYHIRERYEVGLAMGRRKSQRKEEKRQKFLKAMEEAGVRRKR